jgi:hypothetical protein
MLTLYPGQEGDIVLAMELSDGVAPSRRVAPPPPPPGTDAPGFKAAVAAAQAADHRITGKCDSKDIAAAKAAWTNVATIVADQYRRTYTSSNPNAVAALDTQFGGYFRNQGADTENYDTAVKAARNEVGGESPALRKALVQLTDAQNEPIPPATIKTRPGLLAHARSLALNQQAQDITNAQIAVTTDNIQDKLHALYGNGTNGTYTAGQIMQAAAALEKDDPGATQLIKYVATPMEEDALLGQIRNNDPALHLTPGEIAIRNIDNGVTLAFLKA